MTRISATSLDFPREARLLSASDYAKVFSNSRRLSDQYWTVLVHSGAQDVGKLGLAIAKKRAKRAVDRNRIKRIAREAYRHNRHDLVGQQLVIMNRDKAVSASSDCLRTSLDVLLLKARSRLPTT